VTFRAEVASEDAATLGLVPRPLWDELDPHGQVSIGGTVAGEVPGSANATVTFNSSNLRLHGVPMERVVVRARWAEETLVVEQARLGLGDGEIGAQGEVRFVDGQIVHEARVNLHRVPLRTVLATQAPVHEAVRQVPRRLDGQLHITGRVGGTSPTHTELTVDLEGRGLGGELRQRLGDRVHVASELTLDGEDVLVSHMAADAEGLRVEGRGRVRLASRPWLDVTIAVDDSAPVSRLSGAQPAVLLIDEASLKARVTGTLAAAHARGELQARGVRRLAGGGAASVVIPFVFADGRLRIRDGKLVPDAGGSAEVFGTVALADRRGRPLDVPALDLTLVADRVPAELVGVPAVQGWMHARVEVRGTPGAWRAEAVAAGDELVIAGQRLRRAEASLRADAHRLELRRFAIEPEGGGQLSPRDAAVPGSGRRADPLLAERPAQW
jgi:hypothetical protein